MTELEGTAGAIELQRVTDAQDDCSGEGGKGGQRCGRLEHRVFVQEMTKGLGRGREGD